MKSGGNETNEPETLKGLNRFYNSRTKLKQFLSTLYLNSQYNFALNVFNEHSQLFC